MRKPDSLRAALAAAIVDADGVPLLKRDPARLLMFVDQGVLAFRMGPVSGPGLSYEWRYRLTLVLTDFPADQPDVVAIAAYQWLAVHQPDILLNHGKANEAIKFETDVIDEKTVDLQLEVMLSEAVQVTPRAGGGYDIVYPPEPPVSDEVLAPGLTEGFAVGPADDLSSLYPPAA